MSEIDLKHELLHTQMVALQTRIKELEAKLVERDVYEAQQILPPEQAALIKHLATVERCIEEGPFEDGDYGEYYDRLCVFCERDDGHNRDCAWLALQFDRKPAETMSMVEGWAREENTRRDRERARAMTPRRPWRTSLESLQNVFKELWPSPQILALGDPFDPTALSTHPAPATVAPDEAPQHPGLEGEPRRARGGEVVEEGVPPVDHRPPDGER